MSRSSKSFWAFVVGAATGAVLGILYAPDKGENTRSKLYFQLNKYRDQLKQLINDIVDGKEIPETMAKSEGKKVVNDTKIKAEKLLEMSLDEMIANEHNEFDLRILQQIAYQREDVIRNLDGTQKPESNTEAKLDRILSAYED